MSSRTSVPRVVATRTVRAHSRFRGGSDDTEAFRGDRTVSMSDKPNQRTDPANPHAWENLDSLGIEKHNPR